MSPQEFCYWLQGLLELQPDLKTLNEAQVQMIRDHLGYVFTHVQANKSSKPAPAFNPADLLQTSSMTLGVTQSSPLDAIAIC